jgi:hypothetical protein
MIKPDIKIVIHLKDATDREKEFAAQCEIHYKFNFLGSDYVVISWDFHTRDRVVTIEADKIRDYKGSNK